MEDNSENERLHSDKNGNPMYQNAKTNGSYKPSADHYEFGIPPSSIKQKARRKKKICYICVIIFLVLVLAVSISALVFVAIYATRSVSSPQDPGQSQEVNAEIYISNFNYTEDYSDILSEKSKQLSFEILQEIENADFFTDSDISHITFNEIRRGSVILDVTFHYKTLYSSSKIVEHLEASFIKCLRPGGAGKTTLGMYVINMKRTIFTAVIYNASAVTTTTHTIPVTTVTTTTQTTTTPEPVPCEPIQIPVCLGDRVPYAHTAYPNYLGHANQQEASALIPQLQFFLMGGCYPYLQQFVCSMLAPKCYEERMYPPCREMCQDFYKKCGIQVPTVFADIDCTNFPSQDTGMCVDAPPLPLDMAVRLQPDAGPPLPGVMKGMVELELFPSHWVPMCGHMWTELDGDVICRQLNFSNVKRTWTQHDASGIMTFISGVRCMGTEQHIGECEILMTGDVPVPCVEPAWLECENQPEELRGIKMELTGGPTPNEGLLVVYKDDRWGTVCDDLFDTEDAQVACVMMGFDPEGVIILANNTIYQDHTTSTMDIILDNVECTGQEHHIALCAHHQWGEHNCVHKEDIALRCKNPFGPHNLPTDNTAP